MLKSEFVRSHEQNISESFQKLIAMIEPKLEANGFYSGAITFTCVVGVTIQVEQRLKEHLTNMEWTVETQLDSQANILEIKVY